MKFVKVPEQKSFLSPEQYINPDESSPMISWKKFISFSNLMNNAQRNNE